MVRLAVRKVVVVFEIKTETIQQSLDLRCAQPRAGGWLVASGRARVRCNVSGGDGPHSVSYLPELQVSNLVAAV